MADANAVPPGDAIRPLEALGALRALFRNKEDTAQVFRIIDAMAGKTRGAAYERTRSTAAGQALLAARPDLLATLSDRERMQALPQGSLGRTYYDFTYGENLTADGLVAASQEGGRPNRSEEANWFGCRMRDQHDLWHVISGYGREAFGELNLLASTHAQTRNRGIGIIVLFGMVKWMRMASQMPTWSAVREARRRGRACAWLAAQHWEAMLAMPLADVRRQLALSPAPVYARALGGARKIEALMTAQPA